MKSQTDVVVIGGGIGGCSTLYHLTREGITDCVLLERDELTSGTTWHSAAQVTNFGGNQTMLGLKSHSIALYRELAADPDYPINYHYGTGGIRLASTQAQLDGYHHFASQARAMGVDFEVIDAAECKKRHPLISTEGLLGALWDPHDGDIDPAQLTQALARRARKAGAEVHRHTPVTGLAQNPDGTWIVTTPKGSIHAQRIVNAGGYRCNEIGAMMGVVHPVVSMEHQYMLTEPIAEVRDLGHRVPLIRCPTDDFYQRQEKDGLLIGFYEQGCKTWGTGGIDPDFTMALCPDDLDRVTDVMEGAIRRLPCLETAGIHTVINGPITYTPDGLPLVGPIPGKRNAYCITGLRAGLGEGGGHGWLLAQIIAHGEAVYDTWCLDPRRFAPEHGLDYTAAKTIEDYQNEFRFHFPHEHRPAGRPVRTSPLMDRMAALGADFAPVDGWERPAFFRPEPGFHHEASFRRTALDDVIANEVRNVHENAGIMEVNGFNRFELTGPGVHNWLDGILCSRIPRAEGRVGLAYFLNDHGGIKGEATIANLPGGRVWWGSAAASERHDHDWLSQRLPADGSVRIACLTRSHDILVVAGPKADAVLDAAFPGQDWAGRNWLRLHTFPAFGAQVVAMSVSFSGERAFELHMPNSIVVEAFDALMSAGAPHGLKPFGLYATESMRLEKGYRGWKADLVTEYTPHESGLSRFVADKPFVGRAALETLETGGHRRRFAMLRVDDADAHPQPGDAILSDGRIVGSVTSAGFGHRVGMTLAMGFVDPGLSAEGTALSIDYLGRHPAATVIDPCPFDPDNTRLRR